MIFSKRIQAIYKMQVFMRADDTGLVYYFSADDFPGLHRKPYTFTAKAGHKLHGNFYSYHNPIPGRLVVFDHGMGGGHRAYMREIEELARHGYLVFAYDHTGCMESEGPGCNGFAQSLSDLDACLTALKADEKYKDLAISVVGHSWGGFSTMNISALHPDVKHQVAMSGFISVEQIVRQSFSAGMMKFFLKDILKLEQEANPDYVGFSALDSLRKTEAQVLLIHSEDDRAVRCDLHFDVLKRELRDRDNIHFLKVEGRGHNPNYLEDAVKYKDGFFSKMQLLRHQKKLSKPEEKQAFLAEYDWHRMTAQDPAVWEQIFALLDN